MLTIVKRHANIMRCLAAATCCEQKLFSAGESNLQNGFHSSGKSSLLINSSSKVERKEKNKCLNSRIGFHLVPKGTAESVFFCAHRKAGSLNDASSCTAPRFNDYPCSKTAAEESQGWRHGMNPEHESFLFFPPAAHGERKEFCGSRLAAAVCRPH